MLTETPRVTDARPKRDPRLYTVYRLLGSDDDPKDPGLLDNWHHFAETGRELQADSGYTGAIGRSNVPEVAAFVKMASIYADIDAALPKGREGQAVRLYFRGMLDTQPTLPGGRPNPTFGLLVQPNFHQLRAALRCRYPDVDSYIYWGVVTLLLTLCEVSERHARSRVTAWWTARKERAYFEKQTRY